MLRFWRTTMNPAWYHGHGKKPPFFEGWYFKLVDGTTQHRYAVIPGVFLGEKGHAFIQVLDGRTGQTWYHEYPLETFWAADDRFEVHIGGNRFAEDGIALNIDRAEQRLLGQLRFVGRSPWPVQVASPGIMGWYAWAPTMECYHGVLSLDHEIRGTLAVDGDEIDFGDGRGYIEKDWGQSFPSAWIWMQTNHFEQPGTSLTASYAVIPWRSTAFRGFIVGFRHEGRLHRFATYNGAETTHLAVTEEAVTWELRNRTHRLRLRAQRGEQREFGLLKGPTTVDMGKRVAESLTAQVEVHLFAARDGVERAVFVGNGRFAGLEVHNAAALLAM